MIPCGKGRLYPATEVIDQLLNLLHHDFTSDLSSSLVALAAQPSLQLKISAEICIDSSDSQEAEGAQGPRIHLVRRFSSFHPIKPPVRVFINTQYRALLI